MAILLLDKQKLLATIFAMLLIIGWQNVAIDVPLPDVECRLWNGWYGRVGTRGNPYRVNLTAKRLIVRKV